MEKLKRDMVKIEGAFLKSLIKVSYDLQNSQELFGISRTRLSTCLKENKINRKVLYTIASKLKLEKSIFNEVLGIKPLPVFFRKERLEEPDLEEVEKLRSYIAPFLKVIDYKKQKEALPTFRDLPADKMAKQIRKVLSIPSRSVSIEYVIDTLTVFGVHVYFCPFKNMGINIKKKSKKMLRAASIPLDDNWIILLDTSKSLEDVFFDLMHELAHIFAGHNPDEMHSKEIEDYCQSVAKEFFTPTEFFQKNFEYFQEHFESVSRKSQAVGHVDKIRIYLGASFEGVVLKLKEMEIISKEMQNYLYGVVINKKRHSKPLDIFYSGDWVTRLDEDIYKYYYKFFLEVRYLYQEELLTQRSVGKLFNLDFGESALLVDNWCLEIKK